MRTVPERSSIKPIAIAAILAAAAIGLVACAGADHDPVVARVGSGTITTQALTRWMAALAPEHAVPDPPRYTACVKRQEALALTEAAGAALTEECKQQYRALERQALALLISWQWLLGEAAARHLTVPAAQVQARLHEEGGASIAAAAGGAEAALQARAQLSAEKLRQAVIDAEPPITHAQLLDYYHRHIRRFERPELRYLELAENFASVAAAAKVRREVLAGVKLATISIPEIIKGTYIAGGRHTTTAARRAIFAAKPHVLSQPIKLNRLYSFFEITRIVPAHLQPFAQVERSLRARLERERRERTLARSVGAWRADWTARTDCAPGYVVQKCRQYKGVKAPESQLTFN